MQIQPPPSRFRRDDISRRQLLAQDPTAGPFLDGFEPNITTVGGLTNTLTTNAEEHRNAAQVFTGFAVAAGVAALGVGALFSPWAGLGVAAVGGYLGFQALTTDSRAVRAEKACEKVEELATRTQQGLVTQTADGLVIDRRFVDDGRFYEPQEVSRDGEVLSRSVRIEMPEHQTVNATCDFKAGLVTVQGPLGDTTFPGQLELPGPIEENVSITRTDLAVGSNERSRITFNSYSGDVEMTLFDSQGESAGTEYHRAVGLKNGVMLSWDGQGAALAMQSPVLTTQTEYAGVREDEYAYRLNGSLATNYHVDMPPLEALQAADVTDRISLCGADFKPRKDNFHLDYDAAVGQVRFTSTQGEWTVPGRLTDKAEIVMQQGENQVTQSLGDIQVQLAIQTPAQPVTLSHYRGDPPQAHTPNGDTHPVRVQDDGSYKIQLPSGMLSVVPAITLEQLKLRDPS